MKIPSTIISVTLESPDGDATLKFERLKYPRLARCLAAMEAVPKNEKGDVADMNAFNRAWRAYRAELFATCVSVEGMQNPDGSNVTAEQVREMDLYPEVIGRIFEALQAAGDKSGAAAEKNAPSDAAPSSGSDGD